MGKSRDKLILGIIAIMVIGGFMMAVGTIYLISRATGSDNIGFSSLSGHLAQVDILGVIYSSDDIVRQIKKYEDDSSVKGIVLRVDSPGGGVAASQEIYDQLMKFREDGRIVVVSMGSMAASGGYYVSCAADSIVANPGTITGSIGVIMSYPVAEELMNKIGLGMEVIKSGKLKDVGNYARQPTPDDKRMLQSLIDDTYDQFVNVIADSRNIDIDNVRKFADGSIYSGRQAVELGLVDKLGTLNDAIALAGEMADLGDDPRVVKERLIKRPFWAAMGELFGVNLDTILEGRAQSPTLQYLFGY